MAFPRIAAVATATPPHRFTQDEILALLGYVDPRRRGFFDHSEIETRHLAIEPERFGNGETIDELSDRFRRVALDLGEAVSRDALARAGWDSRDVDFMATTTSTGRMLPGLDATLLARLGCRPNIQRVHVSDTGCSSAMVALQQAWNFLHAFPSRRALVVAVEVCSAAYTLDDRLESAVAHAIFADGAGAVALSTAGSGPTIVAHHTLFRPEDIGLMGFEYPGGRPRIVLSKQVRRLGPLVMRDLASHALRSQGLKSADVQHWILHAAGRRVLDGAQKLLGIDEQLMAHSRRVLRRFGNMSSATIVFVLDDVLASNAGVPGDWGVMIGVGPGVAAEAALLRW